MAEHKSQPAVSPGFTLLVSLSTLLVFVVVVLSAYIRLGDAGLGCADWPACFGQIGVHDNRSLAEGGPLLPPSAARSFHRVAATVFGFFVLGIAFLAIRNRKRGGPGVVLPLIVLGLTVFLSVLGVVTPSPLIPAVTTGNVLGGMAMLALLWWIGLRIQPQVAPDSAAAARVKPWARLALVVVAAQIALGAWTSGSFAGPSCAQLSGCADASFSVQNLVRGFEPTRRLERDTQGKVITDASTAGRAHDASHRRAAHVPLSRLARLACARSRWTPAHQRQHIAGDADAANCSRTHWRRRRITVAAGHGPQCRRGAAAAGGRQSQPSRYTR